MSAAPNTCDSTNLQADNVTKQTLVLRKHYSSISIPKMISSCNNNIKNHLSGNQNHFKCLYKFANNKINNNKKKKQKRPVQGWHLIYFPPQSLISPLIQQIDNRLLGSHVNPVACEQVQSCLMEVQNEDLSSL